MFQVLVRGRPREGAFTPHKTGDMPGVLCDVGMSNHAADVVANNVHSVCDFEVLCYEPEQISCQFLLVNAETAAKGLDEYPCPR